MKAEQEIFVFIFVGILLIFLIIGIKILCEVKDVNDFHQELNLTQSTGSTRPRFASVSDLRTQSLPTYEMVMSNLGQKTVPETPPPQFHESYV